MRRNGYTKQLRRPDVNRAARIEIASKAGIPILDGTHMPRGANAVNISRQPHRPEASNPCRRSPLGNPSGCDLDVRARRGCIPSPVGSGRERVAPGYGAGVAKKSLGSLRTLKQAPPVSGPQLRKDRDLPGRPFKRGQKWPRRFGLSGSRSLTTEGQGLASKDEKKREELLAY